MLKDPTALRDDNLVAELRQRLEAINDRLERVQLRQRLRDAENPSTERFEDEFVTHAKDWAEAHGVGASAFAEEGVPDAVLRKAGLLRGRGRGRGRSARKSGGTRSPRVRASDVKAAIPRGTFTTKQLQERTGGSDATVRNVVKEAEQEGLIEPQGSDPDHVGRDRPPALYKRVSN